MKVCNLLDFFCHNSDTTMCRPCTCLITIKETVRILAVIFKVLSTESVKQNKITHILLLLKK